MNASLPPVTSGLETSSYSTVQAHQSLLEMRFFYAQNLSSKVIFVMAGLYKTSPQGLGSYPLKTAERSQASTDLPPIRETYGWFDDKLQRSIKMKPQAPGQICPKIKTQSQLLNQDCIDLEKAKSVLNAQLALLGKHHPKERIPLTAQDYQTLLTTVLDFINFDYGLV